MVIFEHCDYKTLDELLSSIEIAFVTEYTDEYYIRPKVDDYYDNSMYIVNKNTNKVSATAFTEYIIDEVSELAKPVNITSFKRHAKRGA